MKNFGRTAAFLLIGLLVGAGLGLYIGWVAWPTQFSDANPATLDEPYQADYVQLIADIYAADQDLGSALVRLGEFGPTYDAVLLNAINTQLLSQSSDPVALRRVAVLARDAGITSPVVESLLGGAP